MTTSPYSAAGILWSGYIMSVRYGMPLSMQARLLDAAERAELEQAKKPSLTTSAWPDRPCGEQRTG